MEENSYSKSIDLDISPNQKSLCDFIGSFTNTLLEIKKNLNPNTQEIDESLSYQIKNKFQDLLSLLDKAFPSLEKSNNEFYTNEQRINEINILTIKNKVDLFSFSKQEKELIFQMVDYMKTTIELNSEKWEKHNILGNYEEDLIYKKLDMNSSMFNQIDLLLDMKDKIYNKSNQVYLKDKEESEEDYYNKSIPERVKVKINLSDESRALYFPIKGSLIENSEICFDLMEKIFVDFILKSNSKTLAIIGHSCSGKSLFSSILQHKIISDCPEILPVLANLSSSSNHIKKFIPDLFKKYSLDKEIENLKNANVVFILDDFDILRKEERFNLINNIKDFPNSKLIITCRSQDIKIKNLFSLLGEQNSYQQIFLKKFEYDEILAFVKNYFSFYKEDPEVKGFIEDYLKRGSKYFTHEDEFVYIINSFLEKNPFLKNPFIAEIICKMIPNSKYLKEKNFILLKDFYTLEFIFKHIFEPVNLQKIPSFKNITEEQILQFKTFLEDLAGDLMIANFEENNFKSRHIYQDVNDSNNIFNKFFNNNTKLLFKSDMLHEIDYKKWVFSNKIIENYLSTCKIIRELKNFSTESLDRENYCKSLILNNTLITKKDNKFILGFLLDFIEQNDEFENLLWRCVNSTKNINDNRIDYLSSNCFTLLNYSNNYLFGRDYSHLRIPFSDLSESYMNDCTFNNTYMKFCKMKNTNFQNSSFNSCNLEKAEIGEKKVILNSEVYVVKFSQDNKFLAIGLKNGEVNIFDSNGINLLKIIKEHSSTVLHVSFSPNGNLLATSSSDKTAKIFDISDEFKMIYELKDHCDWIFAVDFSPSGKYFVSGGYDNFTYIYDSKNFNKIKSLQDHKSSVLSVTFSPDEKYLASSSHDKKILIYLIENEFEKVKKIKEHSSNVNSIVFSPNGKYLASVGSDNKINVYLVEDDFRIISTLYTHKDYVNSVSFSRCGSFMASAGKDNCIFVYDIAKKFEQIEKITSHEDSVNYITFSPDGKILASGGLDKIVNLLNIEDGFDSAKPPNENSKNQSTIFAICFSKDGKYIVTGNYDNSLHIYQIDQGFKKLKTLSDHSNCIKSIKFSPNGKYLVSSSNDESVNIYDAQNNFYLLKSLTGLKVWVNSVSFSPNGKFLACSGKFYSVQLFNVEQNFSEGERIIGFESSISSICFSLDGKYFGVASDSSVQIYETSYGFIKHDLLKNHHEAVNVIEFSPNCKYFVSASNDKTISIYKVGFSFELINKLKNHSMSIYAVGFSQDSKYLASGGQDSKCYFYKVNENFQEFKVLNEHSSDVFSIAFSENGLYASASRNNELIVKDLNNFNTIFRTNNLSKGFNSQGCKFIDCQLGNLDFLKINQLTP